MTTSLPTESAKQRFHGLDALRAWAMSLGIVLHAAWIMTPGEAGAPSTDASASYFCGYISDSIHMFRMQLFFVLSGFFACLLLRKRGVKRFLGNRFLRIVVPFFLFWAVLRPVMMWQWSLAKIRSGADLSGRTGWQAMMELYESFSAETFLTMHLWFIYYLCWIYVLALLCRGLIELVDRSGEKRDWVSARFGSVATSPWAPLILAIVVAPLMFPMESIYGIEMDPWSLYPKWPGLLSYFTYFVIGWLMFRNVGQLDAMLRGWRLRLVIGCLMTIPFYFGAHYASREGYSTSSYPMLAVEDVSYDRQLGEHVYGELRRQLLDAADGSIAGAAWQLIPEENQAFIRQHEEATENQLWGLVMAINGGVISDSGFSEDVDLAAVDLSDQAVAISQLPVDARTDEQSQRLNREILQAGLPGVLYSEDVNRPYYYSLRAMYCFYYSLTTWLLIFGCLGFSQHFFTQHSFFWRYFSDSSYWMYLMHLAVQFQILLWVGELPWHWLVKFAFYVVGTLLVLAPTYHLLVRPTWLGWLLNGRIYPIWGSRDHSGTNGPPAVPAQHVDPPLIPAPHLVAPEPAIATES